MDQINHMVREHLPADPSEIESHLLSHFASELGVREESVGGELQSDEDELDIEFQDKHLRSSKRTISTKKEEGVKSRARPRKPHEPKPFLSIGNIPPQKTKRLDPLKGVAHDIRQPSFLSNPNVPFNTPSRMLASRNSNAYAMSIASSEWNSVIPKQYKQKQALKEVQTVVPENIHISAPFKHSVLKPPAKIQRPPSPGEALRGKTMAGTQMVAKVMAKQKPALTPRSAGKLLKGKLKPMTPVVVEGPNINRCMGIIPQQQSHSATNSRTVNRRRQIVSTMIEKNLFPTAPHLRPQTVESLHRTSVASSLDENRMDEVKEEPIESPDKTPAPVAPPPSAAVEETASEASLSELQRPEELEGKGEAGAPEQKQRSGSFFVTESEEAENVPHSELSSFKGMDSEVASRPRTAADGQLRKVHFADVEQQGPDGTRRSRSAVARIRGKTSSQQSKKLKKEEQGQGDTMDTMDMTQAVQGPNKEDPVVETTDLVALENSQPTSIDPVEEEEGNTNNNGNQEPRQPLQMAVTDVRQGFNGRVQGGKRGHLTVGRPKPQRGQWEDPCKPDPYIKDLNINTCKPGTGTSGRRTGSFTMKKNSLSAGLRGKSGGQNSRPKSAGGPSSFMLQEKRRAINTARPKSAYVQSTLDMQVESFGAQVNPRNRPTSASVSYAAVPKVQQGRKAYADVDISEYTRDLDESERERIALAHYVQNSRSRVCEVCARSSFRCREIDGKMMCETCSHQKEESMKSGANIRGSTVSSSSSTSSDSSSETSENKELLVDLGDVETSLNQVQEEIKASRAKTGSGNHDIYGNAGRNAGGAIAMSPTEASKTPFDLLEQEAMASRVCMSRENGKSSSIDDDVNMNILDIEPPFDEAQSGVKSLSNGTMGGFGGIHDVALLGDMGDMGDMGDLEVSLNQVEREINESMAVIEAARHATRLSPESGEFSATNGHNSATFAQRPSSSNSFLENVLSLEEDRQQEKKGINVYNLDYGTLTGEDAEAVASDRATGSNMTVYQYAEVENEGESEDKQTAEKARDVLKTEEGQSGGIIEGHISSYQTSLLQPYIEEVYMCDITGSRGSQGPTLPASPYPPLCFHVNARPPPGHVYYFAYGVDMNPKRFATYIGHEVVERYWGLLFGFKLAFNRKGVDQDAIGFPNIQSAVNSSVEGALYLLKTEELALVDGHMGYPEYVEKVMLPVWFLNCTEPDELGVAQYCIPAVTYVARDAWTLRDMRGVSTEFAVRQCVHGADLVSPAYKEYIISQIT